jgi:hypothetical protein
MKTRTLSVSRFLLPVSLLVTLAVTNAGAQQRSSDDFRWDGAISSGRRLYVRNLNGSVRVERATGARAEVTAVKRWRRGNPADVTVEVTRVGTGEGDILVCALWRDITRECTENDYRTEYNRRDRWNRNDRDDDDVSLELIVRVPEGVKLDVTSINGGLDISGATAEVEAHTTNGTPTSRCAR